MLREWLDSFDNEAREKYNKEKKWWEPAIYTPEDEFFDGKEMDWMCDNLGDAQENMDELWKEILRLRALTHPISKKG
jgi:hypothetical protein